MIDVTYEEREKHWKSYMKELAQDDAFHWDFCTHYTYFMWQVLKYHAKYTPSHPTQYELAEWKHILKEQSRMWKWLYKNSINGDNTITVKYTALTRDFLNTHMNHLWW
jgi:hypothetical protein